MVPKFAVDEKVMCYHGPLLYEAKCIKLKKEGNQYQYFVHYQVKHLKVLKQFSIDSLLYFQGWNKNWDEWVTENRMLKQV